VIHNARTLSEFAAEAYAKPIAIPLLFQGPQILSSEINPVRSWNPSGDVRAREGAEPAAQQSWLLRKVGQAEVSSQGKNSKKQRFGLSQIVRLPVSC
jgi:hypothetical protein